MNLFLNNLSNLFFVLINTFFKQISIFMFLLIISILIISKNFLFLEFYLSIMFFSFFISFIINFLSFFNRFKFKMLKIKLGIKKHYFINNKNLFKSVLYSFNFNKNLHTNNAEWNKLFSKESEELNLLLNNNFNLYPLSSDGETFFDVVFSNSIFILILFCLLSYFYQYQKPTYTKTFIYISSEMKNKDLEPIYISNLPTSYSINSILYQNFWEYNNITIDDNLRKLKNIRMNKQLFHYKGNDNHEDNWFNDRTNSKYNILYEEYTIQNKKFNPINIFSNINYINSNLINFYTKNNSLLDTFVVKNKNGEKTNCFIDPQKYSNFSSYFYDNNFELFYKDGFIDFRSLYTPPLDANLKENLLIIIKECRK